MVALPAEMRDGEHRRFDYVLVGGGLQNGLIALGLVETRPGCSLALIERERRLGGNHTWCFHDADLPRSARSWVEPLIVHRWPGYDVKFPNLRRRVDAAYAGFTGDRLHEVVSERLAATPGARLVLGQSAQVTGRHDVTLASGERWHGQVVVDARGPTQAPPARAGFQVFLGLELELRAPHDLDRPLLMDATVRQQGGFRFVYVLPLSSRRLLVEDTYFADSAALDGDAARERVLAYAAHLGADVSRVVREERGCLPMPWAGEEVSAEPPLRAGYAGGWFHPATGYSFPVAVRLADVIARTPPDALFSGPLARLARDHRRQVAYCHRLNRMLFSWFSPEDRWNVFERFYRLPEPLIRRFYALETTPADRARILLGKPPRGLSLRARLQAARRTWP
jgi:lycopene beta-cyclase